MKVVLINGMVPALIVEAGMEIFLQHLHCHLQDLLFQLFSQQTLLFSPNAHAPSLHVNKTKKQKQFQQLQPQRSRTFFAQNQDIEAQMLAEMRTAYRVKLEQKSIELQRLPAIYTLNFLSGGAYGITVAPMDQTSQRPGDNPGSWISLINVALNFIRDSPQQTKYKLASNMLQLTFRPGDNSVCYFRIKSLPELVCEADEGETHRTDYTRYGIVHPSEVYLISIGEGGGTILRNNQPAYRVSGNFTPLLQRS